MNNLTIACVYTGTKYPVEYVHRLRKMVAKQLSFSHRFVVFTDDDRKFPGWDCVLAGENFPIWWAKMLLFSPEWREGQRVIYFDLDTVLINSIDNLARVDDDFAICRNFTRLSGNLSWPCEYGSCCFVLGENLGSEIWDEFYRDRVGYMTRAGIYGDQYTIGEIKPFVPFLQDLLPNFFLGYRDLVKYSDKPPKDCSVVVFAGRSKPHNCMVNWVRKAWLG